jgi:hypothetical protein
LKEDTSSLEKQVKTMFDKKDQTLSEKKERMTFRKDKKSWLVYPEDRFKNAWDLFMTIILLIACIMTPLDIAFTIKTDSIFDNKLSFVIDILFAIDILIIFNTTYYTNEMEIVDNREAITMNYLKGWFIIDILSIIPFDILIKSGTGFNGLARMTRIGKLYKLTRLIRILKIVKEKNKLLKQLQDFLKIGLSFERLFFFIMIFLLAMHLAACIWLITGSLNAESPETHSEDEKYHIKGTWLEQYEDE